MSNEEKLEPIVTGTILGQEYKIQYTFRAAKVFKRLTGVSLLGGFVYNDPEHLVAFIVAGLVQHNRKLVGNVDANGKPDAVMQSLIDRLDDIQIGIEDIKTKLKPFLQALEYGFPVEEEKDEVGKSETDQSTESVTS